METIVNNSMWKKALLFGYLYPYKNEIYYNIDCFGDKRYWKDGKLHRLDGPAKECEDGNSYWIGGVLYSKEDFEKHVKKAGPTCSRRFYNHKNWEVAFIYGEIKHYKDDVYYNIDIHGNKYYWKNGLMHRDDGPAAEYSNGQKEWWKNGLLHRLDGPAVECINGRKEWYIESKQLSEKEFNHKIKTIEFSKDPKWKRASYFVEINCLEHYNDDIYYGTSKSTDSTFWFKDGQLHRDDGPAYISDTSERWFQNDKLHRETYPAYKDINYGKEWYKHGKLHNVNGPAVIRTDDYLEKIHTIEISNDQACKCAKYEWWIDGVKYSQEEFYNSRLYLKK